MIVIVTIFIVMNVNRNSNINYRIHIAAISFNNYHNFNNNYENSRYYTIVDLYRIFPWQSQCRHLRKRTSYWQRYDTNFIQTLYQNYCPAKMRIRVSPGNHKMAILAGSRYIVKMCLWFHSKAIALYFIPHQNTLLYFIQWNTLIQLQWGGDIWFRNNFL